MRLMCLCFFERVVRTPHENTLCYICHWRIIFVGQLVSSQCAENKLHGNSFYKKKLFFFAENVQSQREFQMEAEPMD